jgi:hypothetical protein
LASSAHLGAHRSAAGFDAHARRAPLTLAARSDRRLRRSLSTVASLSRSLRPSRSHRTDPLDSAAVLASQRCACRTPCTLRRSAALRRPTGRPTRNGQPDLADALAPRMS